MIFFIFNAIEGQLISSGAFEIHFNGKQCFILALSYFIFSCAEKLMFNNISDVPIWSKLETGRIPQPLELFQIIDTQLNMQYADVDIG